ncbi:uncharacterized protein [Trachinotus anak]|uniref:uncharacterized protein isoform X2 n=1 Tax=Trachinotus anak TaxID=443729 RepID=UPI0039F23191
MMGSADKWIFETKSVRVGDNVTLTCTRKASGSLFWIRLVSGNFPEVLGKTYSLKTVHRHITTTEEPETFVLRIAKAELSDAALYYCMKTYQQSVTFLNGTDLRVKGTEPDITAAPTSDPVRPEISVTLPCSVVSDSEKKTCPGDPTVYWFRVGADESHPRLIYTHGENEDICEKSPEVHSAQKCVYNFSKNVSFSDAGTHYCAVATCGEILFGNGTKLDAEVVSTCDSQENDAMVLLLCAALAISLIVIAVLACAIIKKSCDCCNAADALPENSGGHRNQQRDEDTWVYSAAIFTMMKTGSRALEDGKAADRERIQAAVKTFGLEQ